VPALDRCGLVARLERSLDRLSPTQRQAAQYVLRHYREVAFMSVAELAAAGVSPAAVVRFATSVEFTGYPELRQSDRFTAAIDGGTGEPLAERGFLFPAAKTRRHR